MMKTHLLLQLARQAHQVREALAAELEREARLQGRVEPRVGKEEKESVPGEWAEQGQAEQGQAEQGQVELGQVGLVG